MDKPDYGLSARPFLRCGLQRYFPLYETPAPSQGRKSLCGRRTFLHGLLRSADWFISISAFLYLPIQTLRASGIAITPSHIRELLLLPDVLTRSQTYAFTVLGMSQLFHAIGMRDVDCSLFRMKHFTNKLMMLAVVLGIALQALVTTVPYFIKAFGTVPLSFPIGKCCFCSLPCPCLPTNFFTGMQGSAVKHSG